MGVTVVMVRLAPSVVEADVCRESEVLAKVVVGIVTAVGCEEMEVDDATLRSSDVVTAVGSVGPTVEDSVGAVCSEVLNP